MQITLDTERMDARQAASVITLMMALWPDAAGEMTATMLELKGEPRRPSELETAARENGYVHSDPAGELSTLRLAIVPTAADAFAAPVGETPEPTAAEAFPFAPGAPAPVNSAETVTSAPADAPQPSSSALTLPAGVELDSAGLPWDGRIHSAGRARTKEGAWRQKRDVPEDVRAAVTAELRAALGAAGPLASAAGSATPPSSGPATTPASGAPTPSPTGPPAPPSASLSEAAPSGPPASAPVAAAEPQPSAPAAPAPAAAPQPSAQAPTAPPAPAAPAATGTQGAAAEFARVMRKVTEAQTAGRATHDSHTAPSLAAAGLTQMRDLLTRPDLLPTFEETFDALLAAS